MYVTISRTTPQLQTEGSFTIIFGIIVVYSTFSRQREDARLHARKLKSSLSGRSFSDSTFLAFDTELYEHNHEMLLEIGFVEFTLKDDDSPKFFHYIITDNEHIKNGDNVPDNRDKFQFGTSERLSLREAARQFRQTSKVLTSWWYTEVGPMQRSWINSIFRFQPKRSSIPRCLLLRCYPLAPECQSTGGSRG